MSDERRDPDSLAPGDESTVRCWIMFRRGFFDRRRPGEGWSAAPADAPGSRWSAMMHFRGSAFSYGVLGVVRFDVCDQYRRDVHAASKGGEGRMCVLCLSAALFDGLAPNRLTPGGWRFE